MEKIYYTVKDIINVLASDFRDHEEVQFDSHLELITKNRRKHEQYLLDVAQDLNVRLKHNETAKSSVFNVNEIQKHFLSVGNRYKASLFIKKVNILEDMESKIRQLELKVKELDSINEEIKNELDKKNNIDFVFPTTKIKAMAAAQKEFWPNGKEEPLKVQKKYIKGYISKKLKIDFDARSPDKNKSVLALSIAIAPD